jgi:chitinase
VRAVATDRAGYRSTAARTARLVDNTAPAVVLADPGATLSGDVALSATASDAGVGLARIVLEHRRAGGAWTEICQGTGSPVRCTWQTSGLQAGSYDLRATATDALGHSASSTLAARSLSYTTPAPQIESPPAAVSRGDITLQAGAVDPFGAGIARVVFQARTAGTTTWIDVCSDDTAPYACTQSSTTTADGVYELRAVTIDRLGRSTPSAAVTTRVDNTAPAAALTPPVLSGTVTLAPAVTDAGSGVASVRIDVAPNNGVWTSLCTDTAVPYTCDWTVPATDRLWDIRVVATDAAGNVSTTTLEDRPGGTRPSATDVQGANGGVAGRLSSSDSFTFTYSEAMAAASFLGGWTGTSTAVTVRITDAGTNDTLAVWNAAGSAALPLTAAPDLRLGRNATTAGATFAATLARLSGTQLRLTLGALRSGSVTSGTATAGTLVWTPSSGATDLIGLPVTTAAATESGAGDADF